jgi:undecaprenyl-diphosphatase
MIFIQAIILGIIQGLTEFLPISSSAHLIIIPWLFGWDDAIIRSLTFDVALHLGTLVATVWYFWADWLRLAKAFISSLTTRTIGTDPDRRLAWFILIASLPGGVVGVLAESKIDKIFHPVGALISHSMLLIMAALLALMGLFLFIADRFAKHTLDLKRLPLGHALLIGLAQSLAVFPGVSRSGSTITAGLALGLTRENAAKFSFLLAAPIIAGAGLKSIYEIVKLLKIGSIPSSELLLFPIGFITASISGYLCIKYFLKFLKNNSTQVFVYYRWLLAIVLIVTIFLNIR